MFTHRYYPEYSGAAIQCARISEKLSNNALTVMVLTLCTDDSLPTEDIVNGIRLYRLSSHSNTLISKIKMFINLFLFFLKYRSKFDVIHTHGFFWYISFLATIFKKRLITKITSVGDASDPIVMRSNRYSRFKLFFLKRASYIITISPKISHHCRKVGISTKIIRQIPNGVALTKFFKIDKNHKEKKRQEMNIPKQALVAIFVGHILKNKGVHFLIDAWHIVSNNFYEDCRLFIVGPYNIPGFRTKERLQYEELIFNRVKELNLTNCIVFTGAVPNVEKYMQISDIFLFPTLREGLGTVILEAMACELPVVVNKLIGVTDSIITDSRNGYLINCSDTQLFAKKIIELLKNSPLRKAIGKEARSTVKKNYDIHRISRQYRDLYQSLYDINLS